MILFNEKNSRLCVDIKDWKEAIRFSANLLVEQKCAEPCYIDGIIHSIEKYGSYIVISDGLAIPHTRPEEGVLKIGFGLVTLKEPIYFEDSDIPVNVLIPFSAVDNNSHIEILQSIVKLVDKKLIEKIGEAKTIEELSEIMKGCEE